MAAHDDNHWGAEGISSIPPWPALCSRKHTQQIPQQRVNALFAKSARYQPAQAQAAHLTMTPQDRLATTPCSPVYALYCYMDVCCDDGIVAAGAGQREPIAAAHIEHHCAPTPGCSCHTCPLEIAFVTATWEQKQTHKIKKMGAGACQGSCAMLPVRLDLLH
jgi:hypothetical protein